MHICPENHENAITVKVWKDSTNVIDYIHRNELMYYYARMNIEYIYFTLFDAYIYIHTKILCNNIFFFEESNNKIMKVRIFMSRMYFE